MQNVITRASFLIFAFLLIVPSKLYSQSAPSIEWQKCFGGDTVDVASSFVKTSDGGYALCGWTNSTNGDVSGNHGEFDAWVLKLSALGIPEWQTCLGGGGNDQAYSIIQTSDDGYAVTGFTDSSTEAIPGNHGEFDVLVCKLSKSGTVEWQKCLGGTFGDYSRSIVQTADDGYALAGYTYSIDGDVSGKHKGADGWVVKLSSSGNVQWQKCLGGSENEELSSIIRASDGGYVVVGYTYSSDGDVIGNHGVEDIWIVKLSSSGNVLWQKCLGGAEGDLSQSVIQMPDGGYVVSGYTTSSDGDVSGNHGGIDAWVIKLDAMGTIEWQKCLGGSSDDQASSAFQLPDGGLAIVGNTRSTDGDVSGNNGESDAWAVKLSATGKVLWQKCLGGTKIEAASAISQSSDGTYYVLGNTESNDGDVSGNHGLSDIWLVKLKEVAGVEGSPGSSATFRNLGLTCSPNPARTTLTLGYTLPHITTDVSINIFNVSGKRIQEIHTEGVRSGYNEATLDLNNLAVGTYYIYVKTKSGSKGGSETIAIQVVR